MSDGTEPKPETADKVAETPADPNTRVVDGAKEYRIVTTRGARLLLRASIAQGGWYSGEKEAARRKRLGKALGKDEAPTDPRALVAWDKETCEFWLSDRLKEHARKCVRFFLGQGSFSGSLDDDTFDTLLINLGLELKDD